MRALIVSLLLAVPLVAQAADKVPSPVKTPAKAKKKDAKEPLPPVAEEARPFADVPVANLTVVDIRGDQAAVSSKDGTITLVRVGDALGLESLVVERIGEGCLALKGFALCTDAPEVPRS